MTQDVVNTVLEWQKDHPGEYGGEIAMADGTLELPANGASLPQLQRIRRAFITLNRQHTLAKGRIRSSFVDYVNDNLNKIS